MERFGIYVHIPFCKSKCFYCDFISYCNKENIWKDYIDSLKEEIRFNKEKLKNKLITTIYIGGGTPSIIDSAYIKEVLEEIKDNYNIDENCEITIEVNPGTVSKDKLLDYKEVGINRLSIGLQSTNNDLLKQIGRIHTYEQFLDTYNSAKEVGLNNINVDLIIGLPNQILDDVEDSLNKVIELNPNHISVYSLILEEGTKLEQMVNAKKVTLPDDELERKMYWFVKNKLEEKEYIHYEISNFAKKGFESKHNTDCWNQEEYIGFGVAAHSYMNGTRFSNIENVEKYIENIKENKMIKNIMIHEVQTKKSKQDEYMMLSLRKLEGVAVKDFKNKFGENPIFIYKDKLEKLVNLELIEIDLDNIKLTKKGLDLANEVWEEFV